MSSSIDDLQVLQTAEGLADLTWNQVIRWGSFAQDTVGKQFTRAVDSTGANIAEAYGRYHFGEKLQFLYYARGSVYESKYWFNRAHKRGLISEKETALFLQEITTLPRQLNGFLTYIKRLRTEQKPSQIIKEDQTTYHVTPTPPDELFTTKELITLLTIE